MIHGKKTYMQGFKYDEICLFPLNFKTAKINGDIEKGKKKMIQRTSKIMTVNKTYHTGILENQL